MTIRSDLEIAHSCTLRPMDEIAGAAGLLQQEGEPYGRDKAKVELSVLRRLENRPNGRLILVTAMTPTPAGEGKTTTSIGLTDGLRRPFSWRSSMSL